VKIAPGPPSLKSGSGSEVNVLNTLRDNMLTCNSLVF